VSRIEIKKPVVNMKNSFFLFYDQLSEQTFICNKEHGYKWPATEDRIKEILLKHPKTRTLYFHLPKHTIAQTAQILGVCNNTVKKDITNIRRKMKKVFLK
jgi:S-methylmethionine-dependent homocysteine/selenocysteine methylase